MVNKYELQKEKAFTNTVYRFFRKAEKDIWDLLIKYDTQKWFVEDLWNLLKQINISLAIMIWNKTKEVLNKWSNTQAREFNSNFQINWWAQNEPALLYIESLVKLHSSNIRAWSIGHTTYTRTIKLVRDWIKEWLTRSEIAKNITKLDPLVFSKERANNIAQTELHNAYEYWRYRAMQDIVKENDVIIEKFWSTANDNKVRASHRKNENDWWIWFNEKFSWTNSLIPPEWNRCRCSALYREL